MNITWKDYRINQNYQRELCCQAEQARLAQHARHPQKPRVYAQLLLWVGLGQLLAAIQSLSLRPC